MIRSFIEIKAVFLLSFNQNFSDVNLDTCFMVEWGWLKKV